MRNAASKVMWVGRATVFMVGLAVTLALVLGVSTTALASIPGDPFRLGQTNGIDAMSTLVGNVTGTMLRVDNNSTGVGATALELQVEPGKAPMKVNSGAKVALLNSDKVDGMDATAFLGRNQKAVDADKLDGLDSLALQRRVSTACEAGSSIRAISEDGTPTCEPDDDTSATQVNALKTELGTNDNTPNETSDPVSYSKVKDIPGNIAKRDADTFDGQDSMAFLQVNQQASDSDKLDGKNSTDFAAAYKRTVVVSPTGTDTQNGTALLDALNRITDASATKKYLLYIEPGTYDLGTGSLQMKQHVDIQGAGELNTLITSGISGCEGGTLRAASNAELRFLTVQNTATAAYTCNAAIVNDSASPRLTHVTAKATGSGGTGARMGVHNTGSSAPKMTDVTATASGGWQNIGVNIQHSSAPIIMQSTLSGSTNSLYHVGTGTSKVALTQLVGAVSRSSGTLQCFNNYDQNLAAVTCP